MLQLLAHRPYLMQPHNTRTSLYLDIVLLYVNIDCKVCLEATIGLGLNLVYL